MKIIYHNKKYFLYRIKIEALFISLAIHNFLYMIVHRTLLTKKNIKIAVCTMGKNENLYIKEFIEYYFKMGIDHIFIYDDNDPNTEQIYNIIDKKYKYNVTIYEAKKFNIYRQSDAFTKCYNINNKKFDWFLMVDMDEFLYIVDETLKGYLTNKRFDKCDFIKINWVLTTDNDLIYYDSRPLFERFKPPFIKSQFVKTIIRGNISNLKFWVHSPYFSPERNITCNSIGKKIYYKEMNFEVIKPINIKKAYIIHFSFKSTEEFIKKIKRGYRNWLNNGLEKFLLNKLKFYLEVNELTNEKIKLIERELKLNISDFITTINRKQIYIQRFKKVFGFLY